MISTELVVADAVGAVADAGADGEGMSALGKALADGVPRIGDVVARCVPDGEAPQAASRSATPAVQAAA